MCLKAVSTDLKANFCEPWLVVFHRNWSRRAEIVAEQQKSPHRKKVGVDGWVNTAFDGQDHCTISTVRLFTRPWSYLQHSDKRYDWTGSYISPFYSNTFYSAPHSPSVQHWPSSEVTWVSASYPRMLWHADLSSKGSTPRASAVTLSTHVCESCHAICVLCSECPGSSVFPVCDLSQ